jgi:uncharacterized protein YjbI with pentapeptide repeats
VLTAFVRGHAPWPPRLPGQYLADASIDQVPELQTRAPDVQAALTVLARRQPPPKASGRLDLHSTDLRKANLDGANLQEASLVGARLQGADLTDARLQKANLIVAQLQGAYLVDAQLQGARIAGAQFQGATLNGANIHRAMLGTNSFRGTTLRTNFEGASLGGLKGLEEEEQAYLDDNAIWPAGFDFGRPPPMGCPPTPAQKAK